MKLKYIFIAAAALVLGACEKSAISPLDGVYQKPEDFISDEVRSYSIDKLGNVRCFNVELANAGSSLNLKLYGDKYYLEPMTYSSAKADAIKKGFYLVGEGGSTYTGGGSAVALDHGGITVSADGENYAFTGTVWLADGRIVKIDSKATLVYEPDPEPVALSTVLSATSNVAGGTPSVTLNLAQSGISSVQNPDYSTTWSGEGYYLAVDLYSADGYLHEGTYTPSAAGGQIAAGQFGIGWDPGDLWGIGISFTDWGTCWWNVSGGAAKSERKITEGTVTVSRKGNTWTIELQSGEGKDMIWCLFNGEIPALTDPGSSSEVTYEELSNVLTAQSNVANGTKSVSLNIGTDGVTVEVGQFGNTFKGNGNYLALDVYSEDGKLAPGTYKANATGGQIAAGEFGIGWDPGDLWGMGIEFKNWGTCWWTVENDVTSAEKVLDGTLVVSVEGDVYTITLESETVNARYVGPVAL